ncbi:MAG: ribosome maturation factor RimP [Clostridia bacterium]|nr:ribosome maturation factor RimP [Clostridia bacterium]
MKNSKSIASAVSEIAEGVAKELGYSIWDVEYVKEGADWYLRITIDSESGITIDDCEKMSRAIDPILDEHDLIEDMYHLEVSSPGIEREIKTDFHLSKCIGERVAVKLFAPIDGQKQLVGILKGFDDNSVEIESASSLSIERKAIAKMNIYFEF